MPIGIDQEIGQPAKSRPSTLVTALSKVARMGHYVIGVSFCPKPGRQDSESPELRLCIKCAHRLHKGLLLARGELEPWDEVREFDRVLIQALKGSMAIDARMRTGWC
jgi:hypothetical protein